MLFNLKQFKTKNQTKNSLMFEADVTHPVGYRIELSSDYTEDQMIDIVQTLSMRYGGYGDKTGPVSGIDDYKFSADYWRDRCRIAETGISALAAYTDFLVNCDKPR